MMIHQVRFVLMSLFALLMAYAASAVVWSLGNIPDLLAIPLLSVIIVAIRIFVGPRIAVLSLMLISLIGESLLSNPPGTSMVACSVTGLIVLAIAQAEFGRVFWRGAISVLAATMIWSVLLAASQHLSDLNATLVMELLASVIAQGIIGFLLWSILGLLLLGAKESVQADRPTEISLR